MILLKNNLLYLIIQEFIPTAFAVVGGATVTGLSKRDVNIFVRLLFVHPSTIYLAGLFDMRNMIIDLVLQPLRRQRNGLYDRSNHHTSHSPQAPE